MEQSVELLEMRQKVKSSQTAALQYSLNQEPLSRMSVSNETKSVESKIVKQTEELAI